MIKCLTCKHKFKEYEKQLTWDYWIDCCPRCGTTIHQGKFVEVKDKDEELGN
jgi:Zn finger protein HypA/HybF involved in hydrogenase expression